MPEISKHSGLAMQLTADTLRTRRGAAGNRFRGDDDGCAETIEPRNEHIKTFLLRTRDDMVDVGISS